MGEPRVDLDAAAGADGAHRPFRAWALQHDLTSLLGGSSDWRVSAPDLGLEDAGDDRPEDAFRGQGFLREALATDPRLHLRIRVSMLLWSVGLVTDILNQISPIGLAMPTNAFWITISCVIAALIFVAIVYPRVSGTTFFVVEQSVLTFASILIFYQCSVTGGASSPNLVLFVLASFYATYLMPRGQAFANLGWFTLLAICSFALEESPSDSVTVLLVLTLIATNWVVGFALIEQRRRENTLERTVTFMALADPLTSIANMRSFEQYLDRIARRDGERFAIILADMNGLKGANAVFGHDTGDGMIVRMSKLLLRASGDRDQVARLGGDEFAVVLPGGRSGDVVRWRKEFENQVERHNSAVRGRLPQISASVGSSLYPDDGIRPLDLLDIADRRMYEAKRAIVAPPYVVDTVSTAEAGRAFRSSRFQDVPKHAVTMAERMIFSALSWFTGGLVAFLAAWIAYPGVNLPVAFTCGLLGACCAALAIVSVTSSSSVSILRLLDGATLLFPFPLIWSTGGASSPLIIIIALPIAFYAQYFKPRFAFPRIAILIVGLVAAWVVTGDQSPAETTRLLTAIATMLAAAGIMQYSSRQQIAALELLRDSALVDRSTGLANVHALRRDLGLAVASAQRSDAVRSALIMVDIDDFRLANSIAGHRGGDAVLRGVAERLADVSVEARAYRIGGDDFVLLVEVEGEQALRALAERYARAAEHDVRLKDASFTVRASVGYAFLSAEHSGDDLIDIAASMLQERKVGKRDFGDSSGPVML